VRRDVTALYLNAGMMER